MSTEEDSGKSRKTFPPSSGEIHIPQMLTNNQEMLKDRPTSSVAEPPLFGRLRTSEVPEPTPALG